MKIDQFSEGIELGDHMADEPAWFIAREDGKIASGPYGSEREARRDTTRLQWFNPSQYFIDYGIQDNDGMFIDAETGQLGEDSDQVPQPGDTIRTKKMQMEGKVEQLGQSRAGYTEVYFRIADGRLMKTPLSNAIVVEKLSDEDHEVMEGELNEISNELLTKYKTAAGKSATAADKAGDFSKGNKRFSGIVKATKKQFANDVKPKTEGTMGGINRSRTAQDVNYQHVLDRNPKTAHSEVIGEEILDEVMGKWNEEQVNELNVGTLRNYVKKTSSPDPHQRLGKVLQHARGHEKAVNRISTKTGDRTPNQGPSRSYEERLSEFVELNEVDKDEFANQFGDLLGRQEQEKKAAEPKRKVIPIDYHGWTIKYRKANKPTDIVDWTIYNHKMEPKHSGKSLSDKDAVSDAEEWIKSGGGTKKKATKKVTIDFNEQFRDEFSPNGETFYANIVSDEGGPALLMSNEPQKSLKKSWPRSDTHLPMIPMSATESNDAELQPNGRYLVGPKTDIGDGLSLFPLTLHSICQSSTDTYKLGKQGLTVATERGSEVDVDEAITPWGGYTADDPKANVLSKAPKTSMQGSGDVRFSDMVKDTIKKHGVKWAFDFYVKKHGLPPRQFQIFAGLTANPPPKAAPKADWTDPSKSNRKPEKKSWWQKLRGKLPFEE